MKILVIGSGGREHALCRKLAESPSVKQLYCAPGNGGTQEIAENLPIQTDDIQGLLQFAEDQGIDLTVVGPELPLVHGITDAFTARGLRIFGPNQKAAQLEGSKHFTKVFLEEHGVPTARYHRYEDPNEAIGGLEDFRFPVVVKADGLCAGKGVIICPDRGAAEKAIREILVDRVFGEEGRSLILEEYLVGFEASVFCIVSKGRLNFFESAKDYKQIGEGDSGPNTGGVGCFSPNHLLKPNHLAQIREEIIPSIEKGLLSDGLLYDGVLFIGFMVTEEGPKVLEFNVRFGDPETQVLLPRLKSDLLDILWKSTDGTLKEEDIVFSNQTALTVILVSGGYPGPYPTGYPIFGLQEIPQSEDLYLIHSGTKAENDQYLTAGGRVLCLTALGANLEECRSTVYANIDKIRFENSYFRKDIGEIRLH